MATRRSTRSISTNDPRKYVRKPTATDTLLRKCYCSHCNHYLPRSVAQDHFTKYWVTNLARWESVVDTEHLGLEPLADLAPYTVLGLVYDANERKWIRKDGGVPLLKEPQAAGQKRQRLDAKAQPVSIDIADAGDHDEGGEGKGVHAASDDDDDDDDNPYYAFWDNGVCELRQLVSDGDAKEDGTSGRCVIKEGYREHAQMLLLLRQICIKYHVSNTALNVMMKALYVSNQLNHAFTCATIDRNLSLVPKFVRYGTCLQCYHIYPLDKCVRVTKDDANDDGVGVRLESSLCVAETFKGAVCGARLSQPSSNGMQLRPMATYGYRPLKDHIAEFLIRPEFEDLIEHWRVDRAPAGYVGDIYDASKWKQQMDHTDRAWYFEPNVDVISLAVAINIDWFALMKRQRFAAGVVYLTIQNLPITHRNKKEWTIVLGGLPGGSEKKLQLNDYVRPLVEELQELWLGIPMHTYKSKDKTRIIRCMLFAVMCDSQASHKLSGFVSPVGNHGCVTCHAEFGKSLVAEASDDDDDDDDIPKKNPRQCLDDNGALRTRDQHIEAAIKWRAATSENARKVLTKADGFKDTILLLLPYVHPSEITCTDYMHNLALGVIKHTFEAISSGWSKSDWESVNKRLHTMRPPRDIGRVLRSLSGHVGDMTAQQWLNLVCIYSPAVFRGLFANRRAKQVWLTLVRLTRLCTRWLLSTQQVDEIERLCVRLNAQFRKAFPSVSVTPNYHHLVHTAYYIRRYGPPYAFGTFGFERANGWLGAVPNNSIEPMLQLCRRHWQFQRIAASSSNYVDFTLTKEASTLLQAIGGSGSSSSNAGHQADEVDNDDKNEEDIGNASGVRNGSIDHVVSCAMMIKMNELNTANVCTGSEDFDAMLLNLDEKAETMPPNTYKSVELAMKNIFYADHNDVKDITVSCSYRKAQRLRMGADIITSELWGRSDRSAYICALWPLNDYKKKESKRNNSDDDDSDSDDEDLIKGARHHPGRVIQFIEIYVTLSMKDGTLKEAVAHRLAMVRWFSSYEGAANNLVERTDHGRPWRNDWWPAEGDQYYIPIARIVRRITQSPEVINGVSCFYPLWLPRSF